MTDLGTRTPTYERLCASIPAHWGTDDYVLTGSAALAVRGVRDVHDLDVLLRPRMWDDMLGTEWPTRPLPPRRKEPDPAYVEAEVAAGRRLCRTGWFDFFTTLPRIARCVDVDWVFEQADVFRGRRVVSLRHCLAIKVLAHRVKDGPDLVRLAELIVAEEAM